MQQTRTSTLTDDVNLRTRALCRKFLIGSVTLFLLFALSFTLIPTLISEASAESVDIGAAWQVVSLTIDPDYEATQGGESASLSTHGNVNFGEIVPTTKTTGIANSSLGNVGTLKILKKTIRIDTTGQYYQVFLSMADDDSNALVNDTNSYISVPAITSDGTNSATYSSPAYFSAQGWGYAVTGNTGAITLPSFFANGDSTVSSSLNQELTYGNNETPYKSVKFAAVPLLSNPQPIYKNTTNIVGGFTDNNADTFNVYYGVMINTDVLAGTYANQIVYTAMASASNLDSASENMAWESYIIAKDSEQEISFDLAASTIPSNISTANTHVYLVPHTEMLAAGTNGYDITALSGYANPVSTYAECEVSSITVGETKSTLTCTSPESPNGVIDNSGTDTNGKFDYWLHISGLNYNYVSKTIDDTEAVAYIGLQSTYQEENESTGELETKNYITKMQEMTGSICKNTNMWGHLINVNGRDDARVYDYRGEQLLNGIATATPLASTTSDSVVLGLGTFALIDNRDDKIYAIRRLGDGNCWMTQSLDLKLDTFAFTHNLTNENTDLTTKAYWDPAESAFLIAQDIDNAVTQDNYFKLTSYNYLGTEQEYQFLPNGIYDWAGVYHWTSKIGDNGETLNAGVSNSRAIFPRSYDNNDYPSTWSINNTQLLRGQFYNWYAATAESNGFDSASRTIAPDSICAKGWQLPNSELASSDGQKSYAQLGRDITRYIVIEDGIEVEKVPSSSTMVVNGLGEIPYGFARNGAYGRRNEANKYLDYSRDYGSYFTNARENETTAIAFSFYIAELSFNDRYFNLNWGAPIRCVARD